MKRELTNISPLRAGIVLAVLYGSLGLLIAPFFILMAILGLASKGGAPAAFGGVFFAILFPVMYAAAGFVGGVIAAAVYNLVVRFTGGLEFEVREVPLTV